MKKQLKEIKLGIGLGPVRFGMTKAEVKLILGEPSNAETFSYSDSDEDLTECWDYQDLELTLNFDEEEDWRLTMISVTSKFYELEGVSLIGLNGEDLLAQLTKLNIGNVEIEDFSEEDVFDNELIEIEDKSLSFWLNDDVLDEIQWTPFFIDEDTLDWPK
ncbi:hypothetical protein EC396_13895 [Lutibacter sp. HS1-25]|uniref:hypothetical protein n=1 Tax=Lutibacter sp. HS1-25 TaxID=2485000 RepID=UPI001012D080|nr:hypothetical protein [Lutibacter sp. HS1-25]RXP46610.1 hypothetical protein EC396_13895 [Lutibacter sp. HS1-25]